MANRTMPIHPAASFQPRSAVIWEIPEVRKRSAVVTSTIAGTSLPSAAPAAGTSIAAPATNRNRPRPSLVEPGGEVSCASPVVSQVPARIPMPVPATLSLDRNPRTDASSCRGATKAISARATGCCWSGASQPSWRADTSRVAAARARNPKGRGLARGRSTTRVTASSLCCRSARAASSAGTPGRELSCRRPPGLAWTSRRSSPSLTVSSSPDQDLSGGFFDLGLDPLELVPGLLVAGLEQLGQLAVPGRHGGLADHPPVDLRLGGQQVELAEIAQQQQAGMLGPAQQLGVLAPHCPHEALPQLWGVDVAELAPVALGERPQPLGMGLALGGQQVAHVVDVVLNGVPVGDAAVLVGQVLLRLMQLGDPFGQPHAVTSGAGACCPSAGSTRTSRTAATLK